MFIEPASAAQIDSAVVGRLQSELKHRMGGDVRFDRLTRTIYSTDASIYRISPIGAVSPRDTGDVIAAVEACRRARVPIVARGAGTGIAGGAVGWGLALDFSRHMRSISALDIEARTVHAQPGVVLDELNATLARHGLWLPADVATSSRATIGGMIANNSCGSRSVHYGRTVDWVESLDVVLADGSSATWRHEPYAELPPQPESGAVSQIPIGLHDAYLARGAWGEHERVGFGAAAGSLAEANIRSALVDVQGALRDDVRRRWPRVLRRNGGYALDRLCGSRGPNPATVICGSEGTLALVVGAMLRLAPIPRHRALLIAQFDHVLDALSEVPRILEQRPSAVELVDDLILSAGLREAGPRGCPFLSGVPRAILIIEIIDDDSGTAHSRIRALDAKLRLGGAARATHAALETGEQQAIWALRNRGFGLLMSRPGDAHPYEFIEDAAVDPSRLRDYITDLGRLLAEEGVPEVGYYAHASVGVIHVRPVLNLRQPGDVARLRRIGERTCDLVARYGGTMTGEHGDGLVRSEWLERLYGTRIVDGFRRIKAAFDPEGLLNPGKIVDPRPMDRDLRTHPGTRPLAVATRMDFSEHGGVAGMAGMCSGVGQCRQTLVGTMCPSYMATLDERHSTRARAVALRAALTDGNLIEGLDDPSLDEVMSLCLSCKACKTECPTGVDMARLKSEWLYQRGRSQGFPRADRFLGHVATWTRLASPFAGIANRLLGSRPARSWMESHVGVDARIPPPAIRPLRRQVRGSRSKSADSGTVVYFADTWTRYHWPEVASAAVQLLEATGRRVIVEDSGCCGRPLISMGLLDEAAESATALINRLSQYAADGAVIAASEPSCLSALVDDIPRLLRSQAARVVAAGSTSVESHLRRDAESRASAAAGQGRMWKPVLFHGHCHQKALWGTRDSLDLLGHFGECADIGAGCCGMAGSFGHLKKHHEVARSIGEQRLFPAVRRRGDAEIAVTGFSCREQIAYHTGARARHVLEILAERIA